MDKQELKNDGVLRRFIDRVEVRAVNDDERTIDFVASDNSVDSYDTVLPVDKWDLTRYQGNGVIGYMHDIYWSDDPDNIIGKGLAFVEDEKLIVRVTFEPADLNEKADKIFRKVKFGSLNAVSVGFAPIGTGHWGEESRGEDPEVYYYGGQELLEVSIVNIPSNKNALKRSFGEDEIAKLRESKPKKIENESTEDSESIIRSTIARANALLAQNQN